jgi:hypothetical protein
MDLSALLVAQVTGQRPAHLLQILVAPPDVQV